MDYKAVKKKWDSWISENLADWQENFGKIFLDFYVDYNGFCLKTNWIIIKEDNDLQFYP